jgi:PAS domain S-box-containing protein
VQDTESQDPGVVDGLRDSRHRLQFFIDHAPGAMAMLDREMRYLAVNRNWQLHHAPDGESLLGRSHYDVYPDMKPEWREAHRRGLAGQPTKVEQERVDRGDRPPMWLRWEVLPWYESPGAVGGVVLFVEDITARVQSDEAARVARQNLADLIGTIDGIV